MYGEPERREIVLLLASGICGAVVSRLYGEFSLASKEYTGLLLVPHWLLFLVLSSAFTVGIAYTIWWLAKLWIWISRRLD